MVPTHFGRQTIVRHFFFYLSVCPFSVCSLSIGSGPDCASLTSFFVFRTSSGATPSPTTKQQQQQQQPISHNSAIAQLSLHPLPPPPFAFPPPPFAYPPPHFAVSLFLRGQKPSSAPLFCLFVVPSTTVWSLRPVVVTIHCRPSYRTELPCFSIETVISIAFRRILAYVILRLRKKRYSTLLCSAGVSLATDRTFVVCLGQAN